jgi:hypothetical protein
MWAAHVLVWPKRDVAHSSVESRSNDVKRRDRGVKGAVNRAFTARSGGLAAHKEAHGRPSMGLVRLSVEGCGIARNQMS